MALKEDLAGDSSRGDMYAVPYRPPAPEAQGSLPREGTAVVRRTRASLGRTVRIAYRVVLSPQVAALTDERERLNAFAQELTDRCAMHEDDLGRLKNAFTALAEHVDAEVGRLDADGRSAATEASGLQAQLDLLKASGARADQALTA
jgi:hypothetical protein